MLELRHLKTLHALREADSLVEAAERLHLTQSALSHQFKELEERLGMQLFVRKTKPVRFTSAGLRLLQLADSLLPQLRTNNCMPRRSSSSLNWCDSADWVRCRRSAASTRLSASRSACRVLRWRSSSMAASV